MDLIWTGPPPSINRNSQAQFSHIVHPHPSDRHRPGHCPPPVFPGVQCQYDCRVYQVRHEANREVTESRLPPFNAVGWLTPRRSHFATTQTHTPPYSNVPWSWTRRVPQCLCLSSGVLLGCQRGGPVAPHPYGGEGEPPPPVGGLAFLRHVRLGAIMCSPTPLRGWGRAALPL